MKPLLSELFLPCSGMHSPIRANRYPLTTITGAQRASGQTHSRARSHQGDADLRADRSTAYLVSCIRVRSAHGNSLDHLIGAQDQPDWDFMPDRPSGLKINDKLEPGRLLDRQIGRLDAAQQLGELPAHDVSVQLNDQRSVSDEAALLRHFRPLVNGWQTQGRNAVENEGTTVEEKR